MNSFGLITEIFTSDNGTTASTWNGFVFNLFLKKLKSFSKFINLRQMKKKKIYRQKYLNFSHFFNKKEKLNNFYFLLIMLNYCDFGNQRTREIWVDPKNKKIKN